MNYKLKLGCSRGGDGFLAAVFRLRAHNLVSGLYSRPQQTRETVDALARRS